MSKRPPITKCGRKRGRPADPTQPKRRREKIIRAAILLFVEHGYTGFDIAGLANYLRIGRGTIYRYFPSKERLLRHCVSSMLADLIRVADGHTPNGEGLDYIKRRFVRFFDVLSARPQLVQLMIIELANTPAGQRPAYFSISSERAAMWSGAVL